MLKTGFAVDICVFDQANIVSNCSAKHPRRYATGVARVFVNGRPSMRDGKRASVNGGEVLREFAA